MTQRSGCKIGFTSDVNCRRNDFFVHFQNWTATIPKRQTDDKAQISKCFTRHWKQGTTVKLTFFAPLCKCTECPLHVIANCYDIKYSNKLPTWNNSKLFCLNPGIANSRSDSLENRTFVWVSFFFNTHPFPHPQTFSKHENSGERNRLRAQTLGRVVGGKFWNADTTFFWLQYPWISIGKFRLGNDWPKIASELIALPYLCVDVSPSACQPHRWVHLSRIHVFYRVPWWNWPLRFSLHFLLNGQRFLLQQCHLIFSHSLSPLASPRFLLLASQLSSSECWPHIAFHHSISCEDRKKNVCLSVQNVSSFKSGIAQDWDKQVYLPEEVQVFGVADVGYFCKDTRGNITLPNYSDQIFPSLRDKRLVHPGTKWCSDDCIQILNHNRAPDSFERRYEFVTHRVRWCCTRCFLAPVWFWLRPVSPRAAAPSDPSLNWQWRSAPARHQSASGTCAQITSSFRKSKWFAQIGARVSVSTGFCVVGWMIPHGKWSHRMILTEHSEPVEMIFVHVDNMM